MEDYPQFEAPRRLGFYSFKWTSAGLRLRYLQKIIDA